MIKAILWSVSFGFLGLHGCQTVPTPPAPAETKSGPAYYAAQNELSGRIEAEALASWFASQTISETNTKTATQGPLDVIKTLTAGTATQKQKDDAMVPVMLALKGDLIKAQAGWDLAKSDAATFKKQYDDLLATVKQERIDAAAELTRQLQAARDEERKKEEIALRHLIGLIFFGGGALCLLATAGVLYFSATVPQLGPRIAIFTGGAGVVLIGSGLAIIELLNHPAIIWWGLGISSALLGCAAVAIWYNHLHALASGQIVKAPATIPVVVPEPVPVPKMP